MRFKRQELAPPKYLIPDGFLEGDTAIILGEIASDVDRREIPCRMKCQYYINRMVRQKYMA